MTSSDTPDTGAGTPLTAEEEAEVRQRDSDVTWTAVLGTARWTDEAAWTAVDDRRRLLATLDAARSRPADCGDHYIAGYKAALAARTCMECGQPWKRGHECPRQPEYARLPVADGPGPEERPALVNDYDTIVGSAPIDFAALSRPLPRKPRGAEPVTRMARVLAAIVRAVLRFYEPAVLVSPAFVVVCYLLLAAILVITLGRLL